MTKKMISFDRHQEVGVLTLNRGITNALNLEFIEQLIASIRAIREDDSIRSLVLESSNDKFFCIGFDIPQLISLSRDDFTIFIRSFNRMCLELYTLPKPTVAAITGHAIAGGCILSLLCDYRFIAEGRKLMGLNEIQLGVPVPLIADCILRELVGGRHSRNIVESGDLYAPDESFNMGMVDEVIPLEDVRPAARDKALSFTKTPAQAFAMIKENRVNRVVQQVLAQQNAEISGFVERWYAEDTRKLIQEAVSKF
jgi:enoyl-CoA hydratase/carnithine racemase